MPPTKADPLSHMDKTRTIHALMAVAHTTFMRTHMQMQRSTECYCSRRPLATQETDNSVRPRTGEKLSPAIRMPATTTIEPSEGMSSGHTRTHTQRNCGVSLDGFSMFGQPKLNSGLFFHLVRVILAGVKTGIAFQNKRAKSLKNKWSRKVVHLQVVHLHVPRRIVYLHPHTLLVHKHKTRNSQPLSVNVNS